MKRSKSCSDGQIKGDFKEQSEIKSLPPSFNSTNFRLPAITIACKRDKECQNTYSSSSPFKKFHFFRSEFNSESQKNPFYRCLHSFKRSNDSDLILGKSNWSNEINGFSVQCIAIGGAIGTGLLVGSGKSLSSGPVPLLLAYLLVSTFIYCMSQSLGELTVVMPISGGFTNYSSKFIDQSWGFSMAWNYYLQWVLLLPMELVAASLTFEYWPSVTTRFPSWGIMSTIYFIIIFMNLFSVKYFGFAEICFAIIKITAIILFIFIALLVDIGVFGNPIGFSYWKSPGIISNQGFYGFVTCVITAVFSFSGSELVGIAAAESRSPEIMIPKAIKQIFWRIGGFYLISLFIISLVVPYNHPNLVGSGKADVNASPFVLALSNIKNSDIFATIMNIVIILSILSVGNSAIYASSRTLIALSENGQAPEFVNYIDKKKRPIIATFISILVGCLSYISILWPRGSETFFLWMMAASGTSVVFSYATICACHIRFRLALSRNGISPQDELSFKAQTGVSGSWYGLIFSFAVVIAQIFVAIVGENNTFSVGNFFQKLSGILVILFFYILHKIYSRIKSGESKFIIPLNEINVKIGYFADENLRQENIKNISDAKFHLQNQPWYRQIYSFWC